MKSSLKGKGLAPNSSLTIAPREQGENSSMSELFACECVSISLKTIKTYYRVYSKYSDTSTPYQLYSKI